MGRRIIEMNEGLMALFQVTGAGGQRQLIVIEPPLDVKMGLDPVQVTLALWVLIRYYFDYERARIWRSGALETSRHDQSVQQPCQEFGGATWAGSVLRRVALDQTEVRANSYAVGRSCRRPERAPRVASSGCDPYRRSRFCAPEAPRPGAG